MAENYINLMPTAIVDNGYIIRNVTTISLLTFGSQIPGHEVFINGSLDSKHLPLALIIF